MRLNPDRFELVQEGLKTIEVRMHDEKRKQLKVSDEIIFVKRPQGYEEVTVKITDLKVFHTFGDAYDHCPMDMLGYHGMSKGEYESVMNAFYPGHHGEVIAIYFEVV